MSQSSDTVTARLNIEIFVDCPKCDYLIDILKASDTSDHDHNDEGHVLTQACPGGSWADKHENFEVLHIECSRCKHEFNVKGLEW